MIKVKQTALYCLVLMAVTMLLAFVVFTKLTLDADLQIKRNQVVVELVKVGYSPMQASCALGYADVALCRMVR